MLMRMGVCQKTVVPFPDTCSLSMVVPFPGVRNDKRSSRYQPQKANMLPPLMRRRRPYGSAPSYNNSLMLNCPPQHCIPTINRQLHSPKIINTILEQSTSTYATTLFVGL